ncbi:hypothetical protein [Stenotrophomonas phage StenR_269]|nr:hypothetical protein [Stenotrophomonas phage StenR_269]
MASRSKYHHLNQIVSMYDEMTAHDMMKYVMLNNEDIKEDGISNLILQVVVHKHLELSIPNVESEFN